MSRKTLDIIISTGGLFVAVLFFALGAVLFSQANFAADSVRSQLAQQKIVFTPADKLSDLEKTWKPGSSCLAANGSKLLETGSQAECYANYYIDLHLEEAAKTAGFPNETYASIGTIQTDLRAKIVTARTSNDAQLPDLQKQLDATTALRDTQFRGETLRGLLLTAYGFSIFGDRAQLSAFICLAIAAFAVVLSLAGFIHALRTPADQTIPLRRGTISSQPNAVV